MYACSASAEEDKHDKAKVICPHNLQTSSRVSQKHLYTCQDKSDEKISWHASWNTTYIITSKMYKRKVLKKHTWDTSMFSLKNDWMPFLILQHQCSVINTLFY